jgi:hypothetical protein
MKAPLPVWVVAALPATLLGHGLAYLAAGRTLADGHHAWLEPTFEVSGALLVALCLALAGSALVRARIIARVDVERSLNALWPRLAATQLALFALMERAEGTHVTLFSCAMQVAVALGAAFVLSLFARLLARCIHSAREASRYFERLFAEAASFIPRQPVWCADTLAVRIGFHRYVRPPPQP